MRVVLEFEEVVRRILEKERVMLDAGSGKPDPRLLIKRQSLPFRPIGQRLPRRFRKEYQAEVTGINPFLLVRCLLDHMRHELMVVHVLAFRWTTVGYDSHQLKVPGLFEYYPLLAAYVP